MFGLYLQPSLAGGALLALQANLVPSPEHAPPLRLAQAKVIGVSSKYSVIGRESGEPVANSRCMLLARRRAVSGQIRTWPQTRTGTRRTRRNLIHRWKACIRAVPHAGASRESDLALDSAQHVRGQPADNKALEKRIRRLT